MRHVSLLFGVMVCLLMCNRGLGDHYFPGNLVFDPVCVAGAHWIEAEITIEADDGSMTVLPYMEVDPNPGQAHFCVAENRFSVGRFLHEQFCGLGHEPVYKVTFRLRTCTQQEQSAWSNSAAIDRDMYYQDWIQASYLFGDFNNDLKVDLADAIELLNFLGNTNDTIIAYYYADLNEDDKVDLGDVVTLCNYLFKDGHVPLLEALTP